MPYVNQDMKNMVDGQIDALLTEVRSKIGPEAMNGMTNYIITRLAVGLLKPNGGWRYHNMAEVIAVFEAAKLEFNRRMVGPYEDRCIKRNGDVKEYWEFTKFLAKKERQEARDDVGS